MSEKTKVKTGAAFNTYAPTSGWKDDFFMMIKKENKTDYEKGYNDAILDVVNRISNDLNQVERNNKETKA